jgi:hypothetical protein
MVTPFSLLNNTLKEIDRIVTVCKEHEVWVMEIIPRFLLKACCDEQLHCRNVRGNGGGAIDAARKILDDLAGLNGRIGYYLAANAAKMISTVDMLTGVPSAAAEVQMDGLYEFWSGDPVHGEKIAYSKIALGLLDLLDRRLPEGDLRFNLASRKRGRDSSADRRGLGGSSYSNMRSDRDSSFRFDRDTPGSSRASRSDRDLPTPRSTSSYRSYPGDFPPPRDRYRRQSGPGPRRDY